MKKIIGIVTIGIVATLLLLTGCSFLSTATKATPAAAPLALLENLTPTETKVTQDQPAEQVQLTGINNTGSIVISINGAATDIAGITPASGEETSLTLEQTQGTDPDPIEVIKAKIKTIEGLELSQYQDTSGAIHIGYGRNLATRGITKAEAEMLFETDFADSLEDLREKLFKDTWPDLPQGIQSVLINMRFQLGSGGFRGFGDMITAVQEHNWPAMANEMKDSLWQKQTPERANALIQVVESFSK